MRKFVCQRRAASSIVRGAAGIARGSGSATLPPTLLHSATILPARMSVENRLRWQSAAEFIHLLRFVYLYFLGPRFRTSTRQPASQRAPPLQLALRCFNVRDFRSRCRSKLRSIFRVDGSALLCNRRFRLVSNRLGNRRFRRAVSAAVSTADAAGGVSIASAFVAEASTAMGASGAGAVSSAAVAASDSTFVSGTGASSAGVSAGVATGPIFSLMGATFSAAGTPSSFATNSLKAPVHQA